MFVAVAVLSMAAAAAAQSPCPGNFSGQTGELTCTCAAGSGSGSVWGSVIYTTDSNICRAAAHAGAISAAGGTVKVKAAPGCGSYTGTTANGVTTSNWGSYQASFYFVGFGSGLCSGAAAPACPQAYKDIPADQRTSAYTCTCGPAGVGGSVWGTGVYTTDSSLCGAAVHAGAISGTPAVITVKPAGGCAKYVGTTANGITTGNWGAYDSSFYFLGVGTGACPL
jgi:hypothetical protein